MKIVSIVGARPQFVKAAMLSRAIKASKNVSEVLVHTGQHYDDDMSTRFFQELDIQEPEYNLGVGSLSHVTQTAKMLELLEPVLTEEAPDWVIVFGDTNSTLAGALAAKQMKIPVAHVEAGLRSYNDAMPEEMNRVVADHVSTLLLAPTQQAVENLVKEGVNEDSIKMVGDVMFDAALYYAQRSNRADQLLEKAGLTGKEYVLATVHRAENTDIDERLKQIFDGLVEISKTMPVVIPLHPRTKKCLAEQNLLEVVNQNLVVFSPVGYLDMIALTKQSCMVATDSGGLQKEAYFFKKPCLTLRNETEWVELVSAGVNRLTGFTTEKIVSEFSSISRSIDFKEGLYGDGNAADKILFEIVNYKQ